MVYYYRPLLGVFVPVRMEENHKKIIQKNYSTLVKEVDVNKLLPKLLEKGVFSNQMVEQYQNKTETEQKRQLFLHVQRRGPHAFDNLVAALWATNDNRHIALACLLENKPYPFANETNQPAHMNNVPRHENHFETGVIMEENEDDNENSRGAWPFTLWPSQRPAHIRQLSEEAAANASINMNDEPLKVKVRVAEQFFDSPENKVPTYRMRSQCRGLYLCINNVEFVNDVEAYREGALVDEENLKILFKEIGFYTCVYRNQTKFDMRRTITEFADVQKNPNLKKADCLVIAIMSHGEEGLSKDSSVVKTTDNKHLSVSWILEQFDNRHCPAFQGKPKIFFFQNCRGDNLHLGVRTHYRTQTDGINVTPGNYMRNVTDMLIGYSTLPGDKAYRDKYLGTWYIQEICKVFMEHAWDVDVESLLKIVDNNLARLRSEDGNMQTSTYENRGFKLCYLHPKLYETKQNQPH